MPHVFVAMSGGVDSSAAALLLQRAGYQVSGVHLRLCRPAAGEGEDARRSAGCLGVPFYELDRTRLFRDTVIREFAEAYQRGETPNPCVICNRTIKFGTLLDWVVEMGGELLATGHYARVERDGETGRYLLKRAADRKKDQSYFLYTLTQPQLSRVVFPLGGLRKDQVREIAAAQGMDNASKRDSQDICFVPDGNYAAVVEEMAGPAPAGNFLDQEGRILGRHKGLIRYTRGQHKGLGLPTEEPLYVLEKHPESGDIVLGPDAALWDRELTACCVNWISIPELTEPRAVTVKTRYSQKEAAAVVEPLADGRVRVAFEEPQRAITPGQAAVFYDGETVVGGGTIC